jgi:hypothetical protein
MSNNRKTSIIPIPAIRMKAVVIENLAHGGGS